MIPRRLNNLLHPKLGEVWMMHRVVEHRSDTPEQRMLEVTPNFLEQKILEHQRKGYCFLSIDDFLQREGGMEKDSYPPILRRRKQKWICLTFDDGYRDNYTLAYPLLKRLGVPFTVYVTTGFIDNQMSMWWYPGERLGISTDELKALAADPLCTIGAHTVSHPHLDTLPPDAQRLEITTSKQQLEALLQGPVCHFSYPHGAYNSHTVDICSEMGIHTAVTTNGRTVRNNYNPLQLDRINIVQPD